MFNNAYVAHQMKLVVLWSPKCACTAAVDWLFDLAHLKLDDSVKVKRRWLAENGFLYNYLQARHLIEDLGYRSVQFTRDPYARAVSAYLNKFCVYRKKPLTTFEDLEPFARTFIRSYNSLNDIKPTTYGGLSFLEYLKHIKYLMKQNVNLDQHWDSQLPRRLNFRILPDFIVKQESFENDLRYVNSKLNLSDYVPKKKNVTAWPDNFVLVGSDEGNSNSKDIIRCKKRLTKENLLNGATTQLINEIYKEDFDFFQYPRRNRGIIERFLGPKEI